MAQLVGHLTGKSKGLGSIPGLVTFFRFSFRGGVAMVLGKLPVPGRPTIWITVGQGPTALAVGADGVVWTFLLSFILLLLSPLFGDGPIWTEICLKGAFNPKQPTNQFYWRKYVHEVLVYR